MREYEKRIQNCRNQIERRLSICLAMYEVVVHSLSATAIFCKHSASTALI